MSTPSRPVLILLGVGITGAQLARELDVTRQAVSLQLRGETVETPWDLLQAIEDLAGEEIRDQVAKAIADERAARA